MKVLIKFIRKNFYIHEIMFNIVIGKLIFPVLTNPFIYRTPLSSGVLFFNNSAFY